jgi:hypothetical protein
MPQEKIDRARESWLRVAHDSGQACLDYERQQLKDPDSARLLSAFSKDGTTTIKYKARNSYGAYGTSDVQCVVNGGYVNISQTEMIRHTARLVKMNQESDARIKEMERQNKCLMNVNDLMWTGVQEADAKQRVRQTAGCEDVH